MAALFIIVPFFAWYGTWFGRDLSDQKISEYLADDKNPRHVQHALTQVAERLDKKDASARQWYSNVVAVSQSSMPELRSNAAWVMGKDNQSAEFHAALRRLISDSDPTVQRNAAIALVVFKDSSGLPVLRSMLQPYALAAPVDGEVNSVLGEGVTAKVGMMLARIKQDDSRIAEVRSPLTGEVEKVVVTVGARIKSGDTVVLISPDSNTVWEALRALYFVGERQDLPAVERYAQGVAKMPEQIKQQAALTAKAIQSRSEKPL